ncbi:Tet(A)/Tet(B)/Tet(C) family tetracycline efflux MFS transporter [Lacibacterium aquatile]|uniref:Tet(A)/Tet(B)/Tet(C) family tetracycline efflux MFS transporter n=1 Tax=Lacibacterium aquatile TaxID=1168082 RepID=A0ABW5DXN7_9PROT
MSHALFVILATVTLDAVGIGLILPILPDLLRELTHSSAIAGQYGVISALYSLMQFICAPVLGMLSDRYGRRPVLLVSLALATVDYGMMAVAPTLWLIYVGRIIAGIAGANTAVATAYITDISKPEDRGRRFGWMSACFGLGLIAGPVLGGWLGEISVRYPFWLAAGCNGLNLLLALFVLPESRKASPLPMVWGALNPFAPLKMALKSQALVPLLAVFCIVQIVGQVGAALWVIHGQDRYAWSPAVVGWSLAGFGIMHAAVQAFLPGPMIARYGERRSFIASISIDFVSYGLMAFAARGWMAFALMPLMCLGGIEQPAMQAMLTRQVDEDRQGELQGLLASLSHLATTVATLGFTLMYAVTAAYWMGAVWLAAALVYIACIPLLNWQRRLSRQ